MSRRPHLTNYHRSGRTLMTVCDDGAKVSVSMTPREARRLAMRLLLAADRAERDDRRFTKKVEASERAIALAKEIIPRFGR